MSTTWAIPSWAEITNFGTFTAEDGSNCAVHYDRESSGPVYVQRVDSIVDGSQRSDQIEIVVSTENDETAYLHPSSVEELRQIAGALTELAGKWDRYIVETEA